MLSLPPSALDPEAEAQVESGGSPQILRLLSDESWILFSPASFSSLVFVTALLFLTMLACALLPCEFLTLEYRLIPRDDNSVCVGSQVRTLRISGASEAGSSSIIT